MQFNATETSAATFNLPTFNLRWSGIFAGLVVGVATNLLLLMLGVTLGLATFDISGPATDRASMLAALWNTLCMVIAAFVGGYVAARGAGMRRTSDGVLHGVVAWGATLLVSALLATSAAGAVFGKLLSTSSGAAAATTEAVTRLQEGDRQAAIDSLRSRLGLSMEQAGKVVDQALVAAGQPDRASPGAREEAVSGMKTISDASAWLSGAVLLSLLGAIGGGLLGARAARRAVGNAYMEKRRTPASEASPRAVARSE